MKEVSFIRTMDGKGYPRPRRTVEYDLFATPEGDSHTIEQGQSRLFLTGWIVSISPGYEGRIRSMIALPLLEDEERVTPSIIDSFYRDDLIIGFFNDGDEPYTIRRGDIVARLVITPN